MQNESDRIFDEKSNRAIESLIEFAKESITRRYNDNNDFFNWSYSDIKDAYVSKFKDEFPQYMTEDIEHTLWLAGYNLGNAVQTILTLNRRYILKSLLKFVDTFIRIQFEDYTNWCEFNRENLDDEEENPS